jgi:hypothetical protein
MDFSIFIRIDYVSVKYTTISIYIIKVVPEQSEKVEYERERLAGNR